MLKSGTKIVFNKTLYTEFGPVAFRNETGMIQNVEENDYLQSDGHLYLIHIDCNRFPGYTYAYAKEFSIIENEKLN